MAAALLDDHVTSLSEFKITENQILIKPPSLAGWEAVAKTLGSPQHKTFIALLIEMREGAGLTQTELASKLGEYQSFVARLESGQRRVDVIEFLKLASVLAFDPHELLDKVSAVDTPHA